MENQNPLAAFDPQQPESSPELSNFLPDPDKATPVINEASNTNLAAHAAMFSTDPNQVVDNYKAVAGQMNQDGTSSVADNLIGQAQTTEREKVKTVLPTLLADKTVSDKDKLAALNNAFDADSSLYHPANILAAESLVQDVPNESEEGVDIRMSLASMIDSTNEYRAAKQKLLNQELAKINPDLTHKIGDLAQTIIPLAKASMTSKAVEELNGQPIWSRIKAVFAEGHTKGELRQALIDAPMDKKMEVAQKLASIIQDTQGIVASAPNDFRQMQLLQETLGQDDVSESSKFADDILGLMDLAFGAGSLIKAAKASRAAKAAFAEGEAADAFVKGYKPSSGPSGAAGASAPIEPLLLDPPNIVVSKVQPLSVSQIIKDTNIDRARGLHSAMAADDTGSVAKAAYGTTRDDAIISDLAPQVATQSGAVEAKVAVPDANEFKVMAPDTDLVAFAGQDGALYYTDAQRLSNQSRIVQDFQQAFGVTSRKEMFAVQSGSKVEGKSFGNGVTIKAVYGPQESGFSDPKSAIEAVKFALRDYGVGDESLQLLQRRGGQYVPVDKNTTIDPGFSPVSSDAGIKAAYDSGHYATANVNGNEVRFVGADHGGDVREVVAFDKDGKRIGSVLYGQGGDRIDNPNVRVNPEWQKKGIANAMYDYAEKHGAKFPTPDTQRFSRSEAGQAFRDARQANPNRQVVSFGGGNGDYLVQVNHNYRFNPFKMEDWPKNTVKNNWAMRSGVLQGSSGAGSLQRHLFNITSMLEPHITLSMSKAVTKMAGVQREFLRLGHDVARAYSHLKAREKTLVMDFIKEANVKGIWYNKVNQLAAGLSKNATDTLDLWKKYWDNHYYFENIDHTRSLSNAGYKKYVNPSDDTNLWARPIESVNKLPRNVHVYDSQQDVVRPMSDFEVTDLYNSGGKIAELEGVEVHNGKEFQHIISRETADGGYLRDFNDFDHTLNYRPGYFHVAYKDGHFIIKTILNDAGKEVGERAVATAANAKDASLMKARLEAMDGGKYTVRGAAKTEQGRALDYRNVQRAKGRSAQRFRGERLENATSIISDPSYSHIQDPMEAMISSARSISRRISMRDPIEAMKVGLMKQYEQFMPRIDGVPKFPNNVLDITNKSGDSRLDKDVAAARSTYEYIQQMEVGYMNHIDDGYKAILNKIADGLGEVSVDTGGAVSKVAQVGETVARKASDVKPTKFARSAANTMFIVTNPIRQLLVQSHQVLQLVPLHPKFFSNPRSIVHITYLLAKQAGIEAPDSALDFMGMTRKQADEMWQHFKLSGNFAAIDSHTMVNGSIKNFVDGITPAKTIAGRVAQISTMPISFLRKVGFDAGENFSQTVTWAAERFAAIERGEDMNDPTVRDRVAARATQFTGNMNKAGQNAYEGNMLNTGLQFMGWAHRWLGIITGSRVFNRADKAKLWTWQLLMYGIPGGYVGYGVFESMLPKDPKTKDIIVQGLAGASYNKVASVISGEDVHADWSSSLNPLDMYGTASHLKEVLAGDIPALFTDSPAGTLLFGGNPKLTNLIKDTAKWVAHSEENKDHPVTLSNVAKDFLGLFGGLSNAYKAKYAFETGTKLSSWTGKVVDSNITNTQALLLLAGIPDMDEAKTRYINGIMTEKYQNLQDDVKKFHDERKRILLNDDLTPDQFRYYLDMTNEFFRAYPHNDTAQNMYKKLVQRDIESGDTRILNQLMKMHNLMGKDEALALANLYPDTDPAKRQQYIDAIKFLYHDTSKDEQEK